MAIPLRRNKIAWALLPSILLVSLILLANTKFTLWPEMMVYPYLLNNGFVLYKDLINPYPPVLTYLFAFLFKQFNYSVNSFQLFTWLVILLINLEVYFVSFKSFGNKTGAILSMAFFAFFSILFGVNGLWFDLIQTPFIIVSVYFFAKAIKESVKNNLDNAFLFATLSIFIKQQAFWLILFYVLTIIFVYKKRAITALFMLPKTILFSLTVASAHLLLFHKLSTLPDFVNWVLIYPFKASSQEGYLFPPTIRQIFVIFCTFLIFIPTVLSGGKVEKIIMLCSLLLLVFSYPRFDYFHLIPALSVLAVLFGKNLILMSKAKLSIKGVSMIALLVVFLATLRFLNLSWHKEVRFFESDILASATLLSMTIPFDETVYIQNGPDQLLPLANKLPPKPWADEFPWYLENNDLQNRIVQTLEAKPPTFTVFKPYDNNGKYILGSYQPQKINDHLGKNYSNYYQMSDTIWLLKRNRDL